jgi:hypothetical protein
MVPISAEDDEIGACFGLVKQSSQQPTKGALQIVRRLLARAQSQGKGYI